jgi:ATP/maltotriose-dependent transcriptional regulator MalT/DNA-binding SARP family transcriptional activator
VSGPAEDAGVFAPSHATPPLPPNRRTRPADDPPADPAGSIAAGFDAGVVRSKVQPPLLQPETLERHRLLDWLEERMDDRLVIVTAEAGYGKTTLLADFARRTSGMCFWYRVEGYDRDWASFITYLHASVREVDESFGHATEALLRQAATMGPSLDVVLSTFLADLGALQASPMLFLLDDFHLVDDSADVRTIMRRLFESAPRSARFLVAARARPRLPLGRLAAQGHLSELSTDDLRFTRTELEALFRSTYRQPLDDEVIDVIEDRTEGWAASLQLVSTSIATRSPNETREFIRDLSGAEGPIYDFLAEEVLAGLPALTARVLLHASLLDEVVPELVAAAMSVTDSVPESEIRDGIQEAEALGLLGRSAKTGGKRRLHPLLKGFLARQLKESMPDARIAAMRMAIAHAAEPLDWLAATVQYASIPNHDEAVRVLGGAAWKILGTGSWGAVSELVSLMPLGLVPPTVAVVRARALAAGGAPEAALDYLDALASDSLASRERVLVSLARATALHMLGRQDDLWAEVSSLAALVPDSEPNVGLVRAWHQLLVAYRGGSILCARQALVSHAMETSREGLDFHAGVSLHNASVAALAQSDYDDARRLAGSALEKLAGSGAAEEVWPAAAIVMALAELESGDWDEGLRLLQEAVSAPKTSLDVYAEAAYVAAITGETDEAWLLLDRFGRAGAGRPWGVGVESLDLFARVMVLLSEGELRQAQRLGEQLVQDPNPDLDGLARRACVLSLLSTLARRADAATLTAEARRLMEQQQAWRWGARLRIVDAALRDDPVSLRRWTSEAAVRSRLALLETVDVLAASMNLMLPLDDAIARSITAFPRRWLPALDRQLDNGPTPAAFAAAQVISQFGTLEHAARLSAFEKAQTKLLKQRGLGRRLVQRMSPTLRIHDLGRTTCDVGGRTLRLSEARRKAAALLLFLVTRPTQTATREQVMEQLWPDGTPSSAANSLHQTLFFLRREVDPWYEDGVSADYVPMQSEVLFLDPSLVHVDSISFLRQANEVLVGANALEAGSRLVRLYDGPFAPEFEYEEWAVDWRNHVHSTYLRIAHATARHSIRERRFDQAIEVLSRATEVDQEAFDLHGLLVYALHEAGARDAASERYRHWALRTEREIGASPPALSELLEEVRREVGS